MEETDALKEPLQLWKTCDIIDNRPPPLIIETFLDTKCLTSNQSLVILDDGKRWDVEESLSKALASLDEVILERWKIELGEQSNPLPSDKTLLSILPTLYKKSIVIFRSLFTYAKFMPTWKFTKRHGQLRAIPALRIRYRIADRWDPIILQSLFIRVAQKWWTRTGLARRNLLRARFRWRSLIEPTAISVSMIPRRC